jgi:sphingomyelin phosphodiesterase 2
MSTLTPPSPPHLNILTFNCWGLKYIAKHRAARISAIADSIVSASPVPHIVCLQELFTYADFNTIRSTTSSVLPYSKYYHSGPFGSGLAILSAFPIIASSMHAYPLNGRPGAFWRGDWYVGKGIACAKIQVTDGMIVEVFNTHLHAPYQRGNGPDPLGKIDDYKCHRVAQAWEIAKCIRGATEKGRLVVAAGDFNMEPGSLEYRIVTRFGGVRDTWLDLHPDANGEMAKDITRRSKEMNVPETEYNISERGITCDSLLNTWRVSKSDRKRIEKGEIVEVPKQWGDPNAKRLDYIFYSSPSQFQWHVSAVKVGMLHRHPKLYCSLSDHFSVEATLSCGTILAPLPVPKPLPQANSAADLPNPSFSAPESDNLLPLITMLTDFYVLRQTRQQRLFLTYFGLSIPIAIGCLVAIFWSPHTYICFILALVSTLSLASGVLGGLMGGLFGCSEMGALKEFEWEIKNSRLVR